MYDIFDYLNLIQFEENEFYFIFNIILSNL